MIVCNICGAEYDALGLGSIESCALKGCVGDLKEIDDTLYPAFRVMRVKGYPVISMAHEDCVTWVEMIWFPEMRQLEKNLNMNPKGFVDQRVLMEDDENEEGDFTPSHYHIVLAKHHGHGQEALVETKARFKTCLDLLEWAVKLPILKSEEDVDAPSSRKPKPAIHRIK